MKRISLYWKCQLLGWSAAALYWAIVGFTGRGFILWLGILHFVLDVTLYIGITHLFRLFSLKMGWQQLPARALLIRIIPSVLVMGLAYLAVTLPRFYLVFHYMLPDFDVSFGAYLRENGFPMYMTGVRLMAIWVLAYYLYQYARRESRLSLAAKDARFDHLRAQLNPHFFFNSLNSIKALINVDPSSARRAVDLLSDLLRHSLYEGEKNRVPLEEELGLVRDYLELEKIRFGQRLQVYLQVEEGLSEVQILPLSIQLLVENAIKHGIATWVEGGTVDIRVESLGDNIQVAVSGPGKLSAADGVEAIGAAVGGAPGREHRPGLGLQNLAERLQLLYPGKASVTLLQQKDEIVCATLQFPRL